MNMISRSKWEKRIMTPIAIVIAKIRRIQGISIRNN